MSKLFIFLALIIAMPALAQKQPESKLHDWSVTRVVDGDTVEFAAPWLPDSDEPEFVDKQSPIKPFKGYPR